MNFHKKFGFKYSKAFYKKNRTTLKGVQTDDLNSDVVRQMFDLVPAVCEFLSKHDAIHINRFN